MVSSIDDNDLESVRISDENGAPDAVQTKRNAVTSGAGFHINSTMHILNTYCQHKCFIFSLFFAGQFFFLICILCALNMIVGCLILIYPL